MLKRLSLYAVAVLFAAMFMTAGCAKMDTVRKDDAITPVQVTKPVQSSKSNETSSSRQDPVSPAIQPADQSASASSRPSQKLSSVSLLQSALDKVYFDFDSANLSESARSTLTKNAEVLKKEVSAKVSIEGNCDELGSAEYNLALGERRAKSARQYLIALGVKGDRLSTVSYGKEKPSVAGTGEEARSKNRRDEFVVIAQ